MVRDDAPGPIVQLRRRVKAAAEEIFDLWTRPELMVRWMSPFPGAVDCKASCDLRPGGAFSLLMLSGDSRREVSGAYVQVDRPRKLVFTWAGPLTNNVTTLVTLELDPRGEETDLTLTHERLPTTAIVEGHTKGWGHILDHLADTVSEDSSGSVSRD
ncbi:MAG: SRPBCC domain-containing protein [Bradyrhizobium sp.]|nr:MAG: SRPBCC domain-containing protein [Bradyrhizobium sp.]